MCVGVSVSPQFLRWGPAGADRTPFISPLPLQTLFFCVYVRECVRVCVCQQAWSAQCGSDVKVIDSRAVTRAIESSCGKRGTLQPHSFQPWGGERDKYRERRKRESKQIKRTRWDEVWTNKWAKKRLQNEWMFGSHRNLLVGWTKMDKIKLYLLLIKKKKKKTVLLLHNHPAYSLISWAGNPGDDGGLWETAHTRGVMSYVGDRPSSPWLIQRREGKYKLQDLKHHRLLN